MDYIFDIALIFIILLFTFIGKKVGFVRSVLSFVKSIVAFIAAKKLGEYASAYLFDNVIKESLTEKISNAVRESTAPAVDAWEAIPKFLRNILANAGITDENFLKLSSIDKDIAETSVVAIRGTITPILSLIFIILFFVILLFLFGMLIKLIDRFFKLPVLRTLNSFMGAAIGILFGIFVVFLICNYWDNLVLIFSQETVLLLQKLSGTSKLKEIFGSIL